MILGVFHSKKNHQILTFFRFMRWIARFDTMNFRKEDLNLGRLQKLRKEVFPDAPGDYEKALFKHGMAHGRLPDGHLSHLTKRFCHRKKKACFSPRISRNTLKAFFFQRKSSSFWGFWWIFPVGIHIFEKKRKALEVNPPVSRANFQIPRCHSKSLHLFTAWWTLVEPEGRTVRVDACPGLVTLVENLKTSTKTTKLEEIVWTKFLRTSEWHLVQWTRREWQIFVSWCKFYDSTTLQRHMWHWYQQLPLSETYHNSPCHRLHRYRKPTR